MMQDEPVPPATDRPGEGGATGGAARRQAARSAAAVPASRGSGIASTAGADTASAPDRSRSQPQPRGSGGPSVGPTTLVGKVLLFLTIILRIVLYPLRRVAQMLFPPKEFDGVAVPGVSDRAAGAFASMFRRTYALRGVVAGGRGNTEGGGRVSNDGGPPFGSTGFRSTIDAIADAAPVSPLMLVYLHSPLHRDAGQFAEATLCDRSVSGYLQGEDLIRCFGASIHTADGAQAADLLGAGSYPYIALLQVKGGGGSGARGRARGGGNATVEMLLKMEGRALGGLNPNQFLVYIQTCVRAHRATLAEAEARRLQREEEATLREEQDREYREALEADRRREAERRAEEDRVADEERRRKEVEREAEQAKAQKIEDALMKMGEEPPHKPGQTTRLRLTLPSGKRLDRRFQSGDFVGAIRAFLVVHFHENGIPIENFSLSTNYPRKTYEDDGITLQEAGLCPQAVLMVHDLDA